MLVVPVWTHKEGRREDDSTESGYDTVYGDLTLLRGSSGNFQLATLGQVVCGTPSLSFTQSGNPSPGNGFWILERGRNCGGAGTYNSGAASQVASRDAAIVASGNDCP